MNIIDISSAKNRLQEYCQQRHLSLPVYYTVEKIGADHIPLFQVEVLVDGISFLGEWASRKREAEKLAAMEALISINKPSSPPKAIINLETKDPWDCLEKFNLIIKEEEQQQEIESMECDQLGSDFA